MTPKTAITGDAPAELLRLEWPLSDDADQAASAVEAVEALFILMEGWHEPLALELRAGCYDREIYTESAAVHPPEPHHLLIQEPRPAEVRLDPVYRPIETEKPAVTRQAARSWLDRILAQPCGDSARYQISLRELFVLAGWTALPPGWPDATDAETLALQCYAGTVSIPIHRRPTGAVIPGPPAAYLVPLPIALAVTHADDALRLAIDVYWSPWIGEIARSSSPLAQGISRLEARGWCRVND